MPNIDSQILRARLRALSAQSSLPSLDDTSDAADDAESYAQETSSFTDTKGNSKQKGVKGYRDETETLANETTSLANDTAQFESDAAGYESDANTYEQDTQDNYNDTLDQAQATSSFNDSGGTSFNKGAKGWFNDGVDHFDKHFPFMIRVLWPDSASTPSGWYDTPNTTLVKSEMRWIQNTDPAFKFEVQTDITSGNYIVSNSDQFTFPATGSYTIDWGDGTVESLSGEQTHTYSSVGTYTIKVSGSLESVIFSNGDGSKVTKHLSWGNINWQAVDLMFYWAENVEFFAKDVPDLSVASSFDSIFTQSSFNQDVSLWDTSNITTFYYAFADCRSFNDPSINKWDVTNVNDFGFMFDNCVFNQSLDEWDMSNTQYVYGMFRSSEFNDPSINQWNTSNFLNISEMFAYSKFNQPLDNWDVSSVTAMDQAFKDCPFNQDISGWNVGNVTNMERMFENNTNFDQDLGSWDVGSIEAVDSFGDGSLVDFLKGGALSTSNYDSLLFGWGSQTVNNDVEAHFGNSKYTAGSDAETARQNLIDNYNWTIIDGGAV